MSNKNPYLSPNLTEFAPSSDWNLLEIAGSVAIIIAGIALSMRDLTWAILWLSVAPFFIFALLGRLASKTPAGWFVGTFFGVFAFATSILFFLAIMGVANAIGMAVNVPMLISVVILGIVSSLALACCASYYRCFRYRHKGRW